MNKLVLASILLLAFSISQAQSKFIIGLRSGVLVSNTLGDVIDYGGGGTSTSTVGSPIVLSGGSKRSNSSFYYGIIGTRNINALLSLSIEANRYDLSTRYSETRTMGSTTVSLKEELDLEVINLPIYATFTFDKFVKIELSSGVYLNSIINATYDFDGSQTTTTPGATSTTSMRRLVFQNLNDQSFGILFKSTFSKNISKLTAGVELFYNRDLTFLDKKENRDEPDSDYARFYAYGIGIQFKYSI